MIRTSRKVIPNNLNWAFFAIIASLCWGFWAVMAKGPSRELTGWMTQVLFSLALLPTALVALWSEPVLPGVNKRTGMWWGFAAGVAAASGDLCFYLALQSGAETSIVIPLVSLYPVVTIVIAFCFLKERIRLTQMVGILIALFAIILLTRGAFISDSPKAGWRFFAASPWILYALAAMALAGVFTAAQKLSTAHIPAGTSHLACVGGFVAVALIVVATRPLNWSMPPVTVCSALAAGLLNGAGIIAAFAAYRHGGKAAIVAPLIAALQPLFTVILARLWLGEDLGMREGWGIVLAVCAAVLLSREKPSP